MIAIVGLLIFSMAGASAKTVVGGVVYTDGMAATANASVEISCTHNGLVSNKTTTTINNGVYSVQFLDDRCNSGDNVSVVASKGDLSGTSSGLVINGEAMGLSVNISFRNVFMTPEFSFYMGLLTLIAAVGVFFVVRKD